MIDIFLTIISGIIFILCWVAAIYLLAYFQHPADNRTASLPKIISVRPSLPA